MVLGGLADESPTVPRNTELTLLAPDPLHRILRKLSALPPRRAVATVKMLNCCALTGSPLMFRSLSERVGAATPFISPKWVSLQPSA